jgi:xanthine dehydrogenase accessory factor
VRRLSEVISPGLPRVLMFGAGHVGRAAARCLAPLPLALEWLASRDDLSPEAGEGRAEIVGEGELMQRIAAAPAGAAYVVFTHSHDLDYRLTRAVLGRGDFGYLGLIGSATKRVRFERRLRLDGIGETTVARLTCPIGLVGLKSKAPAVIAVALAAQLLQVTQDTVA